MVGIQDRRPDDHTRLGSGRSGSGRRIIGWLWHPRSMSRLLTDDEITRQLRELASWTRADEVIHRVVECPTFAVAIALVVDVADEAEQMDHHPDIDIRWRTLAFALTTHSASALTQLDIEMAHRIETLVQDMTT